MTERALTSQALLASRDLAAHDAALVAAIADGDAGALRHVAERHSAMLHRLAYRMLGEASAADDMVQEAMLKLWTGAASWRPAGGGLPAWLRRVVTNLCLDTLRRRRRIADETPPDRMDDAPDAAAAIDAARGAAAARRMVLGLPDRQRAAIVLTYYEDLSNAEAAETLDMNVKAFESLLLRARAALGQQIVAAGVDPLTLASRP